MKREAENFFQGGGREADFFRGGGRGADFEGLYYQPRSDCTRPKAVMGWMREGVAPPA